MARGKKSSGFRRGETPEVKLGQSMGYVRELLKQMGHQARRLKDHARCGPVCWDTAGAVENLVKSGMESADACEDDEMGGYNCTHAVGNLYIAAGDMSRAVCLLGREPPYEDEG